MDIAQKLGYISVIDTLKMITHNPKIDSNQDEKYRVVAPEAMQENFISDSEEEGGEDNIIGDQTYRYLTADEMKSLGDDSLPMDVTKDEKIDTNRLSSNLDIILPHQQIEDPFSPEQITQNYVEYIKKLSPDHESSKYLPNFA